MPEKQGRLLQKILTLRYLPFIIINLGILFSFFIWFSLIKDQTNTRFIASLKIGAPWIALIGGILISFLVAVLLRLSRITRERTRSLAMVSEEFKKEAAERIQAQESKQQLEKALMQGQKLQAIGTLAGGIAHDFNNILYAIIGYTELAREDVPKDSIVYQNLGKVLDGCHRGQDLISRILAFSRRHHHEFKPVLLRATIESILALLKPTIPASVTLKFYPMDEDHYVMGNQTQLHQVIVNLINNAVDAMEGEGVITLRLSYVTQSDPILKKLPKMMSAAYCKIDISDTGHGIDQNILQRIFEPFFTTKEVGKGTGLGLSTVHAIIEEHQGDISVTSQLGHGTTFTILLPEDSLSTENKGV